MINTLESNESDNLFGNEIGKWRKLTNNQGASFQSKQDSFTTCFKTFGLFRRVEWGFKVSLMPWLCRQLHCWLCMYIAFHSGKRLIKKIFQNTTCLNTFNKLQYQKFIYTVVYHYYFILPISCSHL